MEFVPGVHWLKAGYANAYLCVEDDALTLVDSGMPRQAGKILGYISSLGRAPSELRYILLLGPIVGRYKPVNPEAMVALEAGATLPILGELHILPAPGHTPVQGHDNDDLLQFQRELA